MLKRPSSQKRGPGKEQIELPLIPVMDALVTLIVFLVAATALLAVTLIDVPVPLVSSAPKKLNKKPLSLTVTINDSGLRLYSPFRLIRSKFIAKKGEEYDTLEFHEALLAIKRKFPAEKQLVFMPAQVVKYEDIVKLMDASRRIEKGDLSLYSKDEDNEDIVVTELFPEVVFGNILGGGS